MGWQFIFTCLQEKKRYDIINVKDQAEHWKRNYNREHKQVIIFVDEVVKIESMKLKGTCITI